MRSEIFIQGKIANKQVVDPLPQSSTVNSLVKIAIIVEMKRHSNGQSWGALN